MSDSERDSRESASSNFTLTPDDAQQLARLCGLLDEHLHQIAEHFEVKIYNRGARFQIEGDGLNCQQAEHFIKQCYCHCKEESLSPDALHLMLQEQKAQMSMSNNEQSILEVKTPKLHIRLRNQNQQSYLKRIQDFDVNFAIGPAGTGKTFLAVAAAVEVLQREDIKRILLVRPAVEAGEKLGFLPGDLAQKIDPYLRPLYDALNDMLGADVVAKLQERNSIEIAPLAYMRGRTLNHSFVILDESQNTTPEQMKMFLTRLGFGSKAIITGDITQIDLPRGIQSGLKQVLSIIDGVEGIGITYFDSKDVVRHPLVQKIIHAYEQHDKKQHES